MYLHFEDWTSPMFLEQVKRNGLPHGDRIIKVFGTPDDPSLELARPALKIVEVSGDPFASGETYNYGERGIYTGPRLEADLYQE